MDQDVPRHGERQLLLTEEHGAEALALAAAPPLPRCAPAAGSRSSGSACARPPPSCAPRAFGCRDHEHARARDVRLDQHRRAPPRRPRRPGCPARAAAPRSPGSARPRRSGMPAPPAPPRCGGRPGRAPPAPRAPSARAGSTVVGSSASGSALRSSSRAAPERDRIQACTGSIAANSSGLSEMEMSAPASTRLCPSAGSSPSDTPSPGQDERELADLRQARADGKRGVQRVTEREYQRHGGDRLADHDDGHDQRSTLKGSRSTIRRGRTACRPRRRTAPRRRPAAAATPRPPVAQRATRASSCRRRTRRARTRR